LENNNRATARRATARVAPTRTVVITRVYSIRPYKNTIAVGAYCIRPIIIKRLRVKPAMTVKKSNDGI
jgi:hypothetical protein